MITLFSYRDSSLLGSLDVITWRQVTRSFGLKPIQFLNDTTPEVDKSKLVVFDEHGEIPLKDFDHPEEAHYLFGVAGMNDLYKEYPDCPSVRIELPHLIPNQGLFGTQAAAIAMYDREMKLDR